jgi:hypothetical protein
MKSEEAVIAVVDALERAGVPYMLTGSLATNVYAVPRSTADADFVLESTPGALDRLRRELPQLRWEPQLSFETITATTRQILEVPHAAFKIELFFLTDDPHDRERFARRRPVRVFDREIQIASAEDVVVQKLRWSRHGHRRKDIDDVRNLIAVQDDALDWNYIYRWCDQHGTRDLLDELRRSLPPI